MDAAKKAGGVKECIRLLEENRDKWKRIPLNVAVIGNSGVGKSSFINAIRGLSAEDVELGAAPVGVVQTTTEIRSYPHPDNPMFMFWDLPGVGTDHFPRESYLSKIEVDSYDFFLLMTADRFTENDTWLGNGFRERKKKYFFVRTKTGNNIADNKKSHPKTHNEKAVIAKIRRSTEDQLRGNGFADVPVFLIDNYERRKFDFEKLKHRLIEDFPELKRTALILSLQATSEEIIRLKVEELRTLIWMCAVLSGVIGAVAFPGALSTVDYYIVREQADFCLKQLGIDNESLQRLADQYSVDCEGMQAIVHQAMESKDRSAFIVEHLNAMIAFTPVLMEVNVGLAKVMMSVIAAPESFHRTYSALTSILEKGRADGARSHALHNRCFGERSWTTA